MARHAFRVLVRSFVDYNTILRRVSVRDAEAMIESKEARRLSRIKQPLTEIRLNAPENMKDSSAATITRSEVMANAEGAANPWRRLRDRVVRNDAGKLEHREPNYIDDAMSKIELWPEIYDTKAVVICAGKVFNPSFVQP